MTLHITDDLITSDQVASHARLTRRCAESRGTWRVSSLPGRAFTREDAIAAVQPAEARAVFFRLWDAIHQRERHLCVFDEDAFGLNREITGPLICADRFCGQPATTHRDGQPFCAGCAAEHDWFAEHHPIGVLTVSSPTTQGAAPSAKTTAAPCHPATSNGYEVIPS